MQVLAIFSALLGMASSYPLVKTWTLTELSEAIVNPKTDPAMKPYLEDALNAIMLALFTGEDEKHVLTVLPSPTGATTWTVEQLTKAIADPTMKHDYKSSLQRAYFYVTERNKTGNIEDSVQVTVPAVDISTWTRSDVNEALNSPSTKRELFTYLHKARADFNEAQEKGQKRETVTMVTSVGLITHKADLHTYIPKATKRFFKKTIKGLQ